MATLEEVVEEPCKVKIRSIDPPSPHDKSCTCCHGDDRAAPDSISSEGKCQLKSTYYSRLTQRYMKDFFKEPKHVETREFYELRQYCIREQRQFVDDSFPPVSDSINFSGISHKQYEWRRPHEIVQDPEFFVEGATRFDIQQGELGDCWLLAAISTLTMNPKLFNVIVPSDQGFQYKYAGIFHFRFWQYGRWEDVYIDDLLPTYRGRLVFMHSKTRNEFWCALLEKAYAKLYGCYEALKGGNISESMVDLTGGVVETINIQEYPGSLFNKMKNACDRSAMMGCGIEPTDPRAPIEGRLSNGLITRHAYSVTRIMKIPYYRNEVELIRLHNPWGNEAEWKGAWSDQSREWSSMAAEERRFLGITFDDDGEFWMPFQDFVRNFTTMDICDVTPDVFTSNQVEEEDEFNQHPRTLRKQWKMKLYDGEWIPGQTAGGCRNFLDTFPLNPQRIVLLDKTEEGTNDCTLVVSLMQKFVRQRKRFGVDYSPIGFAIYRLPPGVVPGKPLTVDFFRYNASCGKSPYFLNTREVSHNYSLPPGVYVVVPSTFEPNSPGQFLLRIFTESYGPSNIRWQPCECQEEEDNGNTQMEEDERNETPPTSLGQKDNKPSVNVTLSPDAKTSNTVIPQAQGGKAANSNPASSSSASAGYGWRKLSCGIL